MHKFDIPFSYLEWVVATKKYIDGLDKDAIGELELLHNLMAVCYSKMYPTLPREEYFSFSKLVKFYQMWAAYDQEIFSLVKSTQISDEQGILDLAKSGTPYIFCTYHIGSYRLLNSILIANGIDYALVTDSHYIQEQGDKTKELFKQIKEEFAPDSNTNLEILDAESPSIGLQAIRKLKSGTSLLFYIDGNTGVNNHLENKDNYVKINFRNTPYYARKGIAYLSFITKTPIVPVVSVRPNWLERSTYILPTIKVSDTDEKEKFCFSTTQKLYDILAEYLEKYPEQWESWIYVHKSIHLEDSSTQTLQFINNDILKELLVFNKEEYEVMSFGNQQILLEKNTLKIHNISSQFYEVLSFFEIPQKLNDLDFSNFSVTTEAIKELVERKILIIS